MSLVFRDALAPLFKGSLPPLSVDLLAGRLAQVEQPLKLRALELSMASAQFAIVGTQ